MGQLRGSNLKLTKPLDQFIGLRCLAIKGHSRSGIEDAEESNGVLSIYGYLPKPFPNLGGVCLAATANRPAEIAELFNQFVRTGTTTESQKRRPQWVSP